MIGTDQQKIDRLKIFIEELLKINGKNINDLKELIKLPTTYIMKMLYFTCLESVNIENKNTGLFEYFNNFEAWQNGPVEVEVYEMLKNPFSKNSILRHWDEEVNLNVETQGIKSQISECLHKLLSTFEFKRIQESLSQLIDLSHNLGLWRKGRDLYSKKMNINLESVFIEKGEFYKKIGK